MEKKYMFLIKKIQKKVRDVEKKKHEIKKMYQDSLE